MSIKENKEAVIRRKNEETMARAKEKDAQLN